MKTPVISLWMPWANWVMLGWKNIETRTHKRFASLAGKRIGIHASLKWDSSAIESARPYLPDGRILKTESFLRIGGGIIGTALVSEFRELNTDDSSRALIDCGTTKRYGLLLEDLRTVEVIPCRGKQGIWYHDIPGVEPATTPLISETDSAKDEDSTKEDFPKA